MSDRIRLSIISQLIEGRPIHMLRPGTFTGQSGMATTFTPEDITGIVAAFQAGRRPKPPITEGHDFGRAVGRVHEVWSDQAGNLYGRPRWNTSGKQLLTDEVYDGFSIELDRADTGWVMIGGSLTNYPAVSGLLPVTLEAPEPESAAVFDSADEAAQRVAQAFERNAATLEAMGVIGSAIESFHATAAAAQSTASDLISTLTAIDSIIPTAPQPAQRPHSVSPTTEVTPMSDTPAVEAVVAQPTPPPLADPAMNARLDAYFAQNQAYMAQRERQIEQRLQADFERRMHELDQRSAIETFARNATVTALDRPIALSIAPNDLAALLLETPAGVRGKWMTLIGNITRGDGTVSFDEIGSSGESGEAADRWMTLINAKIAAGLSRVEAIRAASKEQPALYAMQSRTKGGR